MGVLIRINHTAIISIPKTNDHKPGGIRLNDSSLRRTFRKLCKRPKNERKGASANDRMRVDIMIQIKGFFQCRQE